MRPFLLIAAGVAIGLLVHITTTSNPDMGYATAIAATSRPALTASPAPQTTINPDLAAGIITRFYRDVDTGTYESLTNLLTTVSPDFVRSHEYDLGMDYVFIDSPKLQIRGIAGRSVMYVLDYDYLGTGGKLYWERVGTWTFNHGARSGWVLDKDNWDSIHLVGFRPNGETTTIPLTDTVFGDGQHEFDYEDTRYVFTATNKTWHVEAIPSPAPTVADSTVALTSGANTTNENAEPKATTDATTIADTTQAIFDDAQSAQAACPSDIVVWVNTRSGVYHFPGTRWYGATEDGQYECEANADAEGDRPSRNGQ